MLAQSAEHSAVSPDLMKGYEMLNSKQKGNLTEMQCMASFIKLGYNVLIPFGDCERYDFVADIKDTFLKIQCKSASTKDNGDSIFIECRSTHYKDGHCIHEKYDKNQIDYIATYWNEKCYLIPVEECGSAKKLRFSIPENFQKERISFAEEYELEFILNKYH